MPLPPDLPAASATAPELPEVRRHPAGGYTHAWPLSGTARIFTGHFDTAPAALRAARGAVSPRLRAALAASRAHALAR